MAAGSASPQPQIPKVTAAKSCIECSEKTPIFGMAGDTRTSWCKGCSTKHPGAIDLIHKMCEDCKLTRPVFGLLEKKGRWCKVCAKQHPGAVDVVNKKCEDCRLKHPGFGLVGENKRRWCKGCAEPHGGISLDLRKKQ